MAIEVPAVIAVGVLFPVLGTIAVALRFWIRVSKGLKLWIDDWLCVPALVFVWAEGGLMIAGAATHAFGWHSPPYSNPVAFLTDDEPSVRELGLLQTPFDLIHPIALCMLKLSILFFYRRIFTGDAFRRISMGVIIFVIVWTAVFFIAIAAACKTHFSANWASLLTLKEDCVDTFRLLIVYIVTDVAVDLFILILPLPLCCAIACGITRMVYEIEIAYSPLLANSTVAGLPATDDLGIVTLFVFWGMVELGVGMVTICLPTLRALFSRSTVESMIRSVRSAISLRSLGSEQGTRTSKGNKIESERKDIGRIGALGSNSEHVSSEHIADARLEDGIRVGQTIHVFQEGRSSS